MKQRVVVQALIQDGDKTLLLRRQQGRPGIVGKYELPGGTLDDSEQPDDSMSRHLLNSLGVTVHELQLNDVISMTNPDDGDFQHVLLLYTVKGIDQNTLIKLSTTYDLYDWIPSSELQQTNLRDSAAYLLGINIVAMDNLNYAQDESRLDVKKTAHTNQVIIYSDGGSRGNPGSSAAAFVIVDGNTVIDQGGEYLGITTNNQAEYHGVRLGLEKAAALGLRDIEFRIDSMLVVNQLKGIYKIKNRELWPINERIEALLSNFKSVKFKHVPRELNTMADSLVNKFLDEHKNETT